MATISQAESTVGVTLTITARPGQPLKVVATGWSETAETVPVRSISEEDVTALLTAAQLTGAENLVNVMRTRLKTRWEIA